MDLSFYQSSFSSYAESYCCLFETLYTRHPVIFNFQDGPGRVLEKSSGRVLGSWLCFRQCFEETSYSSLLHHNFAFISSCYLFCCPANVSWLIGVTLFVSGSRDNWSPDASLAALIAHRTFVTKLVSHFATTIDHNCSAKQGYVDGIFFLEVLKLSKQGGLLPKT